MNVSSRKNQKLIKQYPFVATIIAARMEPFDALGGNNITDLSISVQIADGDLMYRQAHNLGLGDDSFQFNIKRGHIGRRAEYLFAIDHSEVIVNRIDWPRNIQERKKMGDGPYVKDAFLRMWNSHFVWKRMKCLVWVTVDTWHIDTKNDTGAADARFGDFYSRDMHITIYGEPKCGFEQLREKVSVQENLYLNTQILMRGVLEKDTEIIAMSGRLDELCKLFQDRVYFNGMTDVLDKGKCRGASARVIALEVMCAEMCGYNRVMIQEGAAWISFQLSPGADSLYVIGMGGTLPRIRELVMHVIELWNCPGHILRNVFKPNDQICVV